MHTVFSDFQVTLRPEAYVSPGIPLDNGRSSSYGFVRVDNLPGVTGGAFFNALSRLTMTAAGQIGSGVLFTGQTPPAGWDMPADTPDWPYHNHPDAWRYSLIAALMPLDTAPTPDDWFYVGNGPVIRTGQPSPTPAPQDLNGAPWPGPTSEWRQLWLAVNRPADAGLDNGDGAWTVHLTLQELDAMDLPNCDGATPPPRSIACQTVVDRLARALPRQIRDTCDDAHAIRSRLNDRMAAINAVIAIVGVDIAALVAIGVGVFTVAAATATSHAITSAGIAAAVISGALVAGEGVIVAITGQIEAALGVVLTVLLAALGAAAAVAVATTSNPWVAIGVGVLSLIGLALLGALAALIGQQVHDGGIFDGDNRHLTDLLNQWDQALEQAQRLCCASALTSEETTRPSCTGG